MTTQSSQDLQCLTKAGQSDTAANVLEPCNAVEFGEDGLNLPGVLLSFGVGRLQDSDALDGFGLHGGEPSKSNSVACVGVNGQCLNRHWGLSTLASLEGSLAGECHSTDGVTSQRVDAVRKVGKVFGQQPVGVGIGVSGDESFKPGHKIVDRVWSQAFAGIEAVAPPATRSPGGGGGRGDERGGGGDSNE